MKKIAAFVFLSVLAVGSTLAYDQEFLNAHQWMYENEMTMYNQVEEFKPDARVTREQAAKFFVQFDRAVMGRDAETMMYCVYSDESLFDTTLAGSIQSACNRRLMLGSNGVFDAQAPLTKAQALTILLRSLSGTKDETTTPRWKNYFLAAQEMKLTKESDVFALDRPLTRYELALILWRVEHPLMVGGDEQDLSDLYALLKELGLQTE